MAGGGHGGGGGGHGGGGSSAGGGGSLNVGRTIAFTGGGLAIYAALDFLAENGVLGYVVGGTVIVVFAAFTWCMTRGFGLRATLVMYGLTAGAFALLIAVGASL